MTTKNNRKNEDITSPYSLSSFSLGEQDFISPTYPDIIDKNNDYKTPLELIIWQDRNAM